MAQAKTVTEYERKQRVTRGALLAALFCAVVFVVGVGAHLANLSSLSVAELSQQTAQNVTKDDDSDKFTSKQVVVPSLASFIGGEYDEIVETLGTGAQATSMRSVKDVDSAVRTRVDIALTSGVANSSAGTPTVHLGLNEDNAVIQAGYTVNMRFLGYGSLSFIDAAENYHVIETTLAEAGLLVAEGSVKVPEAKADYAIYGHDGVTLAKEDCTFEGVSEAGYAWTGELTYDYTEANAENNLAYTVRMVTVTVIGEQ